MFSIPERPNMIPPAITINADTIAMIAIDFLLSSIIRNKLFAEKTDMNTFPIDAKCNIWMLSWLNPLRGVM